jgi:hypothetical protein
MCYNFVSRQNKTKQNEDQISNKKFKIKQTSENKIHTHTFPSSLS